MEQPPENAALAPLLRDRYGPSDFSALQDALRRLGTLELTALPTGLYPAATGPAAYRHVWVRDNVHVANACWAAGNPAAAAGVARGIIAFWARQARRFDALVAGDADPSDPTVRPHVRFDGAALSELPGGWSHAQNDALGAALWLVARLARAGHLALEGDTLAVVRRLLGVLQAIRYWEDEDSGHWEETRRVSASSIGVVVAGLDALLTLLAGVRVPLGDTLTTRASELAARGRRSLAEILPSECVQPTALQSRRYDAALLFLIHPFGVVRGALEECVLQDARRFLVGRHGVRRYLGDSYWAPDYDTRLRPEDQTRERSGDLSERDVVRGEIGDEAQWCIFDPILSARYGARWLEGGAEADRAAQTWHMNRALSQVTAAGACPEAYYLRDGHWVPNPHTPLLWTQANLLLALKTLEATVRASG